MMSAFSLTRQAGVTALASGMAVLFVSAAFSPSIAQKRSPEIRAEENRDPAAGEVVIINPSNFKKRKAQSPDPYAPIRLKPLTDAKPNQKKASAKPTATKRQIVRKPDSSEPKGTKEARKLLLPPLPEKASQAVASRSETTARRDRLRQFPLRPSTSGATDRATASRQNQADQRQDAERKADAARRTAALAAQRRERQRAKERSAQQERATRRQAEAERRQREAVVALREREEQQRWRTERQQRRLDRYSRYNDRRSEIRRSRRSRPWRVCRRLAWGCRDGYSEDCYLWRQRCRN